MIIYAVENCVTDDCTFAVTETLELFFKEEDAIAHYLKLLETCEYDSDDLDVVKRTIK